ncbi:MAG: hypothetical protein QOI95_421 [Acidimicrobiaceae bacterium]
MKTTSLSECKRLWDTVGWCVVEGVIPPDDLAAAQRALPALFPTADEFAADAEPERNVAFREPDGAPKPQFPFSAGALNRVVLHDAMLELAELLLNTDDLRLYQAMANAKYSDGAPDYDQLLHVDYANHTLVVPRADDGYQLLETFVFLSDVTPETAATRFVSREHTADIPVERTYLHLEEYAHLYAHEESASGPAGSVLVYRPDVFHRGVPLTAKRAARFMLAVAFKPAATDWIGFHAFPARAEDMAWHRFMRHATVRQLTVLGFPKPGDAYWTPDTLAGVAARYPSLDMTPWSEATR